MMQTKSFQMDFKTEETEDGLFFSGYASVFGVKDSDDDIVEKGAFSKTIQERFAGGLVKVLWQHDEPFGIPVEMEEDEKGLRFRAKVSNTAINRDRLQLMKDKVVDRMSIGYITVKSQYDQKENANRLKEIKLYEISPVTFASNEQATVDSFKSLNRELKKVSNEQFSKNVDLKLIDDAIETLKSIRNCHSGAETETEIEPVKTTQSSVTKTKSDIDTDLIKSIREQIRFIKG